MPHIPRLLDTRELALRLAVSRSTVYRHLRSRRLRIVRLGRLLRVADDEFVRFVRALQRIGREEHDETMPADAAGPPRCRVEALDR